MKIAITGGTGLMGSALSLALSSEGHEVVSIARRGAFPAAITDEDALTRAFAGCAAIAHCAGINRELGSQTYARVHVEGTRAVVRAARRAGVRRIAMVSFLRARPNCGSPYHESKWEAEEIVRNSGLDYTILKCGIVYGRGDHLLDHTSRALHTLPLFAAVGLRSRFAAPAAVEDVARILSTCLVGGRLTNQTVTVLGPERLDFRDVVRRIARASNRRVWIFPMPVRFHLLLGAVLERVMKVPLIAVAQVKILAEGVADPLPGTAELPPDLKPLRRFTEDQIRCGLPASVPFGRGDLRCCCERS